MVRPRGVKKPRFHLSPSAPSNTPHMPVVSGAEPYKEGRAIQRALIQITQARIASSSIQNRRRTVPKKRA
jgi:hypothetical protein